MTAPEPPPSPIRPGALLRRTIARQRRPLAAATALVTVWQVCEVAVPVLIGVVIDQAVATGDAGRLLLWSAVLCVHFTVLSLAFRFGDRIALRALQTESHRLRVEVSAHVLAPRGARTDRLPGDVLSIATGDAEMVGSVIRQVSFTAAGTVGLVVTGVVLATIDPLLAVVVLVGVPVVLVCTQVLAPRLAHRSHARQEAVGRANGLATDLVRGLRPLKGIGAEDAALARYRGQSRDAMHASVAAARWEGVIYGITQGLSGIFLGVVALIAGVRAADGELSIGELVAVVGLAQFVAEPMNMLTYLVAALARSRGAARRIVDLLATPPLVLVGDRVAPSSVPPSVPSLTAEGVGFGPLHDVSFEVAPGRLVAVIAEDPADAAALMTLLRGEAAPTTGRLLLGSVPLTDQPIDGDRAALLVAEHQVDLFEGTLRSNVDPAGRLTDVRLDDVLADSSAADIVSGAEHGVDEPVAVNGTSLSGGQRQRLGLARAYAADPVVLVLHDPTTAVDAMTELRIADRLRSARHGDEPGAEQRGRSTLVLTSSPALLDRADEVVHLRAGRVAGRGTHDDLLAHPVAGTAYAAAVLR